MASLGYRYTDPKTKKTVFSSTRPKNIKGGAWTVLYRVNGKKKFKSCGKDANKEQAEAVLAKIENNLAQEKLGLKTPESEIDHLTLDEFLEKLPQFLRTKGNKPMTIERYTETLKTFAEFCKTQGVENVDKVKLPLIEKYKDHRRNMKVSPNGKTNKTKRGVSNTTLVNELTNLSSIWNEVIKRGHALENPFKDSKKGLPKPKPKLYEPLKDEAREKLLDALPEEMRMLAVFLLHTGLRRAEMEHLRWEDVDEERNVIIVQPHENWTPKTGEKREIPIHSETQRVLDWSKEQEGGRYVFNGENPAKIRLWRALQSAAKRAGVRPVGVHDLRKEFASRLVMKGVGIETVSHLLGHSNIQQTWDAYVHLLPNHNQEAVAKLDF